MAKKSENCRLRSGVDLGQSCDFFRRPSGGVLRSFPLGVYLLFPAVPWPLFIRTMIFLYQLKAFFLNGPRSYENHRFFGTDPLYFCLVWQPPSLYKLLRIGLGHSPCAGNVWRMFRRTKKHVANHMGTLHPSYYSQREVPKKPIIFGPLKKTIAKY